MTPRPVPVAVIGAGNMGANHIRVYDELPGADLVAVVEPDPDRAAEVRDAYDVTVLDDVADLDAAAAVTIAVPNRFHRDVAIECLDNGLDVLVEKPLAETVADARAIVEAAEAAEAVLQVGHIERFNPAVETLKNVLSNEQVIAIETHRLGPFNEQLSEESVVFDLMIHDLDIIDYLVDGAIAHLDAVGRRSRSHEIDHAVANMNYCNGVLATAVSSHVTHGKIREIDVTTKDAYIHLDYQEQSVTIQRRGVEQLTDFEQNSGYRTKTVTEKPFVQTREPLKNELKHFLDCVRERSTPRVDGTAGIDAARRATQVVSAISNQEE